MFKLFNVLFFACSTKRFLHVSAKSYIKTLKTFHLAHVIGVLFWSVKRPKHARVENLLKSAFQILLELECFKTLYAFFFIRNNNKMDLNFFYKRLQIQL